MQAQQHRLKDSVYALEEPTLGLYLCLAGETPRVAPLRQASIVPAASSSRAELVCRAAAVLSGQPYEIVRVDA